MFSIISFVGELKVPIGIKSTFAQCRQRIVALSIPNELGPLIGIWWRENRIVFHDRDDNTKKLARVAHSSLLLA